MARATATSPTSDRDGRPRRVSTRRGKEGREKILRAMLGLVDEKGYEGATIAELARRSGLPASSVYWHFSSKDDILAAALEYSYREKYSEEDPWPTSPDDRPLIDQLVDAVASLEGDGAGADYIRVGLALALQRRSSAELARQAFLDIRQEAKDRLRGWWQQVLDRLAGEPVDPRAAEAVSRLTLAVLDGRYLTGQDMTLAPANTRMLALVLIGAATYFAEGGALPQESRVAPGDRVWTRTDETGREALLAAAIDVLCDHGPTGTTVARICERSGLPASSLYWHFDDLDALVTAALDTAFARWSARTRPWADERTDMDPASVGQRLRLGFGNMLEEPEAFRIGHMLLLQRGESEARRRFRQIRREVSQDNAVLVADWLGVEAPPEDIILAATTSLPGILSWAMMTVADGLFMVETVSPRWPLVDASDPIAAGFEWAMTQLVDELQV